MRCTRRREAELAGSNDIEQVRLTLELRNAHVFQQRPTGAPDDLSILYDYQPDNLNKLRLHDSDMEYDRGICAHRNSMRTLKQR